MSAYEFDSYTEALESANAKKKLHTSGWTLIQLASACDMQPSYVTNVLKGRAHFNSDQLFKVCEALGIGSEESDYLSLVLEWQRTQVAKRKSILKKRIDKIKQQQLRAEKNLEVKKVDLSPVDLERFYLDPLVQLVHIFLGSSRGKHNSMSLAKKFKVSELQMQGVVKVLEEIKYVRRKEGHLEVLIEGRHLPSDSPMLKPHQILMRVKSLEQMQRLAGDEIYSFSATISSSVEVKNKLKSEFLKFLKNAEKLVRANEGEELLQMNFDLFPWDINSL